MTPAADARTTSSAGAQRPSDAVVLGAAYGQTKLDGSFGADAGSFRTREQVVSLFGALRMGGFYGTGIVSIADIDFRNVHRNIVLGPMVRTASASPSGSNASAFFNAGYDFTLGRVRVGPTVSVTSQSVDVDAFDESGAGSADLHIAGQSRRSEVWSAGVRASMDLNGWTPWLRVTSDRERHDDARYVTASPLSLATGNSYDILAYAPDTSFTTAAIGVNGWIGRRVALGLAYFKVSGRSGIKEDGVSGTLSYKF